MISIGYILSLIVFPIVNMILFIKTVYQYQYSKNNKRVFRKISHEFDGTQSFLPKPKDLEDMLKKNNVATHLSKEYARNYRKIYNSTRIYCICVVVSAICLIIASIALFFINRIHTDFYVLCIFFSSLFVFGVQIPPLLKSLGHKQLTKIADALEYISYEIISPNGKISIILLEVGTHFIIFCINMFIFYGYILFFNVFSLPDDLIISIMLLFVYQYLLLRILSWFWCVIYKRWAAKKGERSENLRFDYVYHVMKNNTYLLFLLLYLVVKYVQIHANINFGIIAAESIAILFLFDTYIAQCKECAELKNKGKRQF